MSERGVARPDMGEHDHGEMSPEDRRQMTRDYHRRTVWLPVLVIIAGVWLATTPFTFGYWDLADVPAGVERVTAERDLAAADERGRQQGISDLVGGLLLIAFGILSLRPGRVWSRWAACGVGVWLLFAPLVFWSPSAAAYATGTAVGILVIAATILIPAMPGMMLIMRPGPERPPGWSYNPSSWHQRAPIIALGLVGLFFSRYLAAHQLGYLDWAHDPFFGDGTVEVLTSDVSMAFPISDAGVGAAAITIEALMGFMGSTSRWRTMPWMVTFFGILVIPLGIVHVVLVVLQPVAVGTWCTFCLATAGAMLLMIPLAVDEVVAMAQFVRRRYREGQPFWSVFIKGDTVEGGGDDDRTPQFPGKPRPTVAAGVWGVSLPPSLVAMVAAGIWLMASADVLDGSGAAADANRLLGTLAVVVGVVATAEVIRAFRFLALPTGAALAVLPWLLAGAPLALQITTAAAGLAIAALSIPRGPVKESYGGAERLVV